MPVPERQPQARHAADAGHRRRDAEREAREEEDGRDDDRHALIEVGTRRSPKVTPHLRIRDSGRSRSCRCHLRAATTPVPTGCFYLC